ncbi:MAG: Gfo/Idh/MocA family oxidoreductase [Lentisphaerae bacterium]|jgi:predicted dehydrogenase|nr:Gfo/Idh/MocA family oxidoreductase [Lentisphaerota bacterium]MBT4819815.1 Gfo/Idh/MocA family oxidoreductase [Lentisphaerota bacterium]MBT5610829.1 Gfo/Idh/MocA family oxidoreductase [Lentisphaerota bacterium]MBT7053739.1 Gfo/Idh/MocA family oxidoreductase [Lentisphaerota bacterium]MBT7841200.1 Gfo/Idh/MocA family oxidoreductase [Lentisphaerota bacterium]
MAASLSRRHFAKLAAASTVYSLIPGRVLGANERVNVAFIGCGGMGKNDAKSVAGSGLVNVVGLCDVAIGGKRTAEIERAHPGIPTFSDFRKMFDVIGKDIHAVTVATPDHSHFPIAMLAMSLGKHVYIEKPLCHTFQEAELLMAAEKKYKVSAQMGNQGHSGANYFQFKAWTEAGIIKDVTRITAYMNKGRRWHGWKIDEYPTGESVPAGLDWDTWLATRPHREFSGKLHPGNWRGWFEFGNGAFGDWGPHILDTAHRFLKLGLPNKITALKREGANDFIYPQASTIRFSFPARGEMPPVEVTWYDGKKNRPPRPEELEPERKVEACGKIIYGRDLVFKGTTHGSSLRIIPESKMRDLKDKLPRIKGRHSGHHRNFVLACKGDEKTRSSLDVAGPLTQVFCLGVIAQRLGGELSFDLETKQFKDNALANELLVGPPPRKGWEEFYRL